MSVSETSDLYRDLIMQMQEEDALYRNIGLINKKSKSKAMQLSLQDHDLEWIKRKVCANMMGRALWSVS
jgi:hypothetical protein